MEVFAPKANGTFTLEPYEAGWAGEAIAMIYVRELHGPGPAMKLNIEISVDGVRWMDHSAPALLVGAEGGHSLCATVFGNWLRLRGEVSGGPADGSPAFYADFYWVLKS